MLRRLLFCVAVGIGTPTLSGCADEPQPSATVTAALPSAGVAESSWQPQIEAVREAQSDTIRTAEEKITAAQFQQLGAGCESLTVLMIDEGLSDVGDMSVLSHLPKLRQLKLPGPVDDAACESISHCTELELLNLPEGVFSDRACEKLAELDQLMLLRFGSPHVTDEGVQNLSRLPRLRFLHLLDVPISDAALESIASIESLESFYLDGGRVSDKGLRRLIEKRPDLHVHLDQTHIPGDPNGGH